MHISLIISDESDVSLIKDILEGTSKNTNFRGSGYGISVVSGFSGSQYGN